MEASENTPVTEIGTNEQTPRQIVEELDKYIIGQDEAKRSVAIALRNRWRSRKLEGAMRDEVIPKNILMIGSTGVGKTEIARRLAKLVKAPFIMSFMFEVPEASRPAVEICSEMSAAGIIRSAKLTP